MAPVALAIAILALAIELWPSGREIGPVNDGAGSPGANSIGSPEPANSRLLEYAGALVNQGDTPVVLKDVEALDATPGLRVIGAAIADPGVPTKQVKDVAVVGAGFSCTELFKAGYEPLPGHIVAPASWFGPGPDLFGHSYQVVIGMQIPHPGTFTLHGFSVSYVADGETHEDSWGPTVSYCVGAGQPLRGCKPN